MTVEHFVPDQGVTVTDAAKRYLTTKLQAQDRQYIHLTLVKSGCAGFKYDLACVDEVPHNSNRVELESHAVFIDEKDLPLLSGMQIDLVVSGLNQTITYRNPNVVDSCGCGVSVGFEHVN